MDDYKIIVANNLKSLREKRKLSLDKAAKLTGISKSMISQIEKAEVNPSISTIWKLANGFKVSFTELMSTPKSKVEVTRKKDVAPILEDDGCFRNYPMVHFDPERRFEVYYIEVDEGGKLQANPHAEGTQEYVLVTQGVMKITVGEHEYELHEGDIIRFKADSEHGYENIGDGMCVFQNTIYYEKI